MACLSIAVSIAAIELSEKPNQPEMSIVNIDLSDYGDLKLSENQENSSVKNEDTDSLIPKLQGMFLLWFFARYTICAALTTQITSHDQLLSRICIVIEP